MTTMTEIFKIVKEGYKMGRAINSVAKKRSNPMAAVSLVWGSIFSSGLKFNWGLRFVPKSVIEGKEGGIDVNTADAIFATIPKFCCVLVCLENLKEITRNMSNNEWACLVIRGIAHEYRHAQQDEFFESVGIDSNYALKYIASRYSYTESPVEQDAIQYSMNVSVYLENSCPKIRCCNCIEVSEAMKEVAKEIENHPQVFDYTKA